MTTARPDDEAIFHAARDIPDRERRREYVRAACGGDETLIAHVEALLAVADSPDSLLDRSPEGDPVATIERPTTESPGKVIGPYKLIEQVGEGGMGTVWMAQQTEPVKRLVAVKLIKAGMDSRQVIARFEAERQALALMDHPNIARVLDGGTTGAGRPYFVMDLVKGVPITRYCDEHHLTPRQRLELFIPVCQAIQHAHQKGIIHRDLKPSNVLVSLYDGKPVPKIIDFGVAKATGQQLTDKTLVTGFGALVGTLEYMSPEQAEINQLDIDTRSDIYSLGVLLYELLAGSPPFSRKGLEKAGMLELLRVIREDEPSKPSTKLSTANGLPTLAANRGTEPAKLTKLVRGELDWIVMKALEKDRNRRYETANGFAMDVQRYLADEAVLACPPSAGYRLRKFTRRNMRALAMVAVVAAAVLALITGTLVHNARLGAALDDAQTNLDKATRAEEQTHLAEREKTRQLAIAHLREAQARRNSGLMGRRFESLEALKKAVEHFRALGQLDQQRTLELRNEAIACLALADMKPGRKWAPEPGWSRPDGGFHASLQYYAVRSTADDHPDNGDGHQGHLSVRRVADDQEVARLPGFGVRVVETRFSPDSRYLAAHYEWQGKRHVYVWDLSRREAILKVAQGSHNPFPSFSPDSRLVALSRPDNLVRIYELPSGAAWKNLPSGLPVRSAHFHPDGRRLAVVSGSIVQVRDLEDGKELAKFKHPGAVFTLAWRSDGKVFATGCYDNDISLWDMANPAQPLRTLKGHFGAVTSLAFSHGGDLLFSCSWDSTDRLWDPMTGQMLVIRPGGVYREHLFSPDDQGLNDGWQVATGRERRTFHSDNKPPRWVAISPNGQFRGRLMASVDDDGLQLWDLSASREGDKLLDTLPSGGCQAVHFDPNGESLNTDSKRVGLQRWPITSDAETGGLRIGPPKSPGLSARAPFAGTNPDFALSADGRTVAQSPYPGHALVFDLENPRRKLHIESPRLRHTAFSPDGRWLATGNWQHRGVKVSDAQTGKLEADLDLGELENAWPAFSPDGKWLVTGTFAEYRFWEVGSWHKKHGLARDNAGRSPSWIVFSPDGRMLAVLHSVTEVRLVDPATGREFARLPTGGTPYCFSPDGSQLVTYGGSRGAMHVWDLRLIRRQLKEMGLDWDLPPYPSLRSETAKPLRVKVLDAEPLPPSKELDAEAYFERGLLYVRLRKYASATNDFSRARALDPKLSRWEEVIGAYAEVIERNPEDAEAYRQRAHYNITRSQWDRAAADFARADWSRPVRDDAFEYACVFLIRGDQEGYAKFCRQLIQRAGKTNDPLEAYILARTCALSPKGVVDPAQAIAWGQQALAGDRHPWYLHALGLSEYRAGQFDQALQSFTEANVPRWRYRELNWFGLSLAHHQLGHDAEARQCLQKGIEWLGGDPNTPPVGLMATDWLEAVLLCREAEALLKVEEVPEAKKR